MVSHLLEYVQISAVVFHFSWVFFRSWGVLLEEFCCTKLPSCTPY